MARVELSILLLLLASCRGAGKEEGGAEEAPPVAAVRTAPIERKSLSQRYTLHGSVVPSSDALQVRAPENGARIKRVLVAAGQRVAAGELLLEIEPSVETAASIGIARSALRAAQSGFELTRRKLDEQLATNQDLAAARQALDEARLRLRSLEAGNRRIVAPAPGMVGQLFVNTGEVAAAGTPLLQLVSTGHLEARLSAELDVLSAFAPGQPVAVRPVVRDLPAPIAGTIRALAGGVDPDTRQVAVLVTLPENAPLLVGEPVTGSAILRTVEGLVVPRNAVLSSEGKQVLYTVRAGHAFRHEVELGIETESESQVIAPDLAAGDAAVVEGNHELEDGMAVRQAGP